MIQRPEVQSLMVCEKVVYEDRTQKLHLLGLISGIAEETFPTPEQRFDVFASITEGLGDITMKLSVVYLDKDEEIYSQMIDAHFAEPRQIFNLRCRVRKLKFNAPAKYMFVLEVVEKEDGKEFYEEIGRRRVRVYQIGG